MHGQLDLAREAEVLRADRASILFKGLSILGWTSAWDRKIIRSGRREGSPGKRGSGRNV